MSKPIFHPSRVRLCTLAVVLALVVFAYLGITHGIGVYEYAFPVLLTICLVGIKWAAPAIPLLQIVVLIVLLFLIHYLVDWLVAAEHLPPLALLGDKVVEVVCVFGFGAFWVRRGYIPASANHWPE